MTHEDMLRFRAIGRWVIYALTDLATPAETAEAIEGLAAWIRADHSPQTSVRSTTLRAENESGRATHHTPPAMARPTEEVRRA